MNESEFNNCKRLTPWMLVREIVSLHACMMTAGNLLLLVVTAISIPIYLAIRASLPPGRTQHRHQGILQEKLTQKKTNRTKTSMILISFSPKLVIGMISFVQQQSHLLLCLMLGKVNSVFSIVISVNMDALHRLEMRTLLCMIGDICKRQDKVRFIT